jgi:hypothetical protein
MSGSIKQRKADFRLFKIQDPIHSKTLLACRQCLTDGPKADEPLGVCPSETENTQDEFGFFRRSCFRYRNSMPDKGCVESTPDFNRLTKMRSA